MQHNIIYGAPKSCQCEAIKPANQYKQSYPRSIDIRIAQNEKMSDRNTK